MPVIHLALLIIALISFLLGAANIPSRVNFTCLGLAFWVLSLIIT